MKRTMPRPLLPLLALLTATGCGTPLTLSQRIVGEWVGRPETAAERTLREWPTRDSDPDDPEMSQAAAETPPTDLESFPDVRVSLQLTAAGHARLSLAGGEPLEGRWSLSGAEGRRAVLEIRAERGPEDDPITESRRFDLEVLRQVDGEGFVLREQGADRRFGRLLFRHPGDDASPPTASTASTDAPQDEAAP